MRRQDGGRAYVRQATGPAALTGAVQGADNTIVASSGANVTPPEIAEDSAGINSTRTVLSSHAADITDLASKINEIRTALRNAGLLT